MEQQLYAEAGCKPKLTGKDYAALGGLAALGVVAVFVALFTGAPFWVKLIALAGVGAVIYFIPSFKYEYEYIFCDGQLDFDKIMSGSKRKNMLQVDFEQVECVAPEDSHSAQGFHDAKVLDFSSREQGHRKYVILCKVKEERTKIYFEPSEKMISAMQAKAPRKVQA